MKIFLLLSTLGLASCQLSFDRSTTKAPPSDGINTRLGLLANTLGVSPVGSTGNSNSGADQNSNLVNGGSPSGRVPSEGEFGQQCCCVPTSEQCGDPFGREDLVGLGLIDPRLKNSSSISTRIVNTPVKVTPITSCPNNQKTCCYDNSIDLSVFGRTCISPQQANNIAQGIWRQNCTKEQVSGRGVKQCGTRQYRTAANLGFGEISPGEFPWACLLLNQDNDFVGTCALIPNDFSNNNDIRITKVVTAAHKLKNLKKTDLLKVRVGEYDASGVNPLEPVQHQEYTVVRILKHPQFNPKRLDNNMAILTLDRKLDLSPSTVNTACLPSCDTQFDFKFDNGTGTRCWVAGWGKNAENGQFQFIPRKVDLPIYDWSRCQDVLKNAMNERKAGLGDRFRLSPSEICAGGEKGKDACTGDGGSPLVCQASSGRWTVVGLVTWGVGCASDVPGVYARMSYFRNWINAN